MRDKTREKYVSPQIEVIPVETEGVIAGSPGSNSLPGVGNGGNAYSARPTRSYNSAGSSEIEDLINDILTVEQ